MTFCLYPVASNELGAELCSPRPAFRLSLETEMPECRRDRYPPEVSSVGVQSSKIKYPNLVDLAGRHIPIKTVRRACCLGAPRPNRLVVALLRAAFLKTS